ncbi:MAG: response regulator transcription factor [Proteobacteria bacterium]|nr:response regulator transcription factor [Pseudomonadota bacterium]
MPEILIVDDEPHLREVVRYALEREGYTVREASDGRTALAEVARSEPDLMVLDVLMPELDGIEVCRRIRSHSRLPIVFLSSRGEELDRVLGLELGGDDYVTKPFSPRELVSRVKAVLRRTLPIAPSAGDAVSAGPIRMLPEEHRLTVGDTEIELTVTEFRMLLALVRRPGKVYTREELVTAAYEGPHFVSDRTVDSHVRHIRKKLKEGGLDPIETVHGLGYRLART